MLQDAIQLVTALTGMFMGLTALVVALGRLWVLVSKQSTRASRRAAAQRLTEGESDKAEADG